METKTITVPNISCGHCTAAIEEEIGELDGVTTVSAEEGTKQVTIQFQAPLPGVASTKRSKKSATQRAKDKGRRIKAEG